MKFKISQQCDYVQGHLRYGHFEGEVEVNSEAELRKLLEDEDIRDCMELIVDDYACNDYDVGNNPIKYEKVEE